MKSLICSLVLLSAIPCGYSQILNGGFEDWLNGQPNDWTLARGFKDSNSHSEKFCFAVQYADIQGPSQPGDAGTAISNYTSHHPNGSTIPQDANSISFWYYITGTMYDAHL